MPDSAEMGIDESALLPAIPPLQRLALASPKIATILAGRAPDKVIAAGGGKLINIVIRDA